MNENASAFTAHESSASDDLRMEERAEARSLLRQCATMLLRKVAAGGAGLGESVTALDAAMRALSQAEQT